MVEYELYHHGVKGMKWGVRRYQNKNGTLTDAGKKRYGAGESNLIKNDDGYILKKGTIVQRISTDPENEIRDYTFVSFTKHDNEFYSKNFKENIEFADSTANIYKNTFAINRDLKIPSEAVNKQIFLDLYKERTDELVKSMGTARRFADISYQPSSYKFKARNEIYKGDYKRAFADAVKYYEGRYSKMTVEQLQNDAYYDFMNSLSDNKEVRNTYFNKLKAKGFDAVIDDNDVSGLGARGYKRDQTPSYPLLILNANDTLERRQSSRIKKSVVKKVGFRPLSISNSIDPNRAINWSSFNDFREVTQCP